jgi:hypothetical protein
MKSDNTPLPVITTLGGRKRHQKRRRLIWVLRYVLPAYAAGWASCAALRHMLGGTP